MKILVAIDGSKSSLHAAKFAVSLCTNMRSKDSITLINVQDDQGIKFARRQVGKAEINNYFTEFAKKDLKLSITYLNKTSIKHNSIIHIGHVAETIINTANKGFDMVVLGAKGRGAINDFLIGSVAHRVLSKCKKPVLLIK